MYFLKVNCHLNCLMIVESSANFKIITDETVEVQSLVYIEKSSGESTHPWGGTNAEGSLSLNTSIYLSYTNTYSTYQFKSFNVVLFPFLLVSMCKYVHFLRFKIVICHYWGG